MSPRADLLDHILGGMEDAAARLRGARQRVAWGMALQGVRLSQGLAEQRIRVEDSARRGLDQMRRGAARPFERVAGALVERLPVVRRGDFLRLEGRLAMLTRELDALAAKRRRRAG